MISDETRVAAARLATNRSLIVERALAAGAVGMVPVPGLDDFLTDAIRKTLLLRIASVRQVGLDERAAEVLAGPMRAEVLDAAARAAQTVSFLRRRFTRVRRLALALRVADRLEDAAGTFAAATLFDHYCASHHIGPGIDLAQARRLREAIEASVLEARGRLFRRQVRGAAKGLQRLTSAVPRALIGRFRSARTHEAPVELLTAGTALVVAPGNLLQRSMTAVGRAASGITDGWIEELLVAFDSRWKTG